MEEGAAEVVDELKVDGVALEEAEAVDEVKAGGVVLEEAEVCSVELDGVVGDAGCDVEEVVEPA